MSEKATAGARFHLAESPSKGPVTRTDALLESIAWSLLSIAESLDARHAEAATNDASRWQEDGPHRR